MNSLIKSKQRIKDHGEVFTPDFIVQDMLDLVKNETERIESRFLEPACGDGNFLAPVLQRKLDVVLKKYGKSQSDFEKMALLGISSIYGVDILEDNVRACKERLYKILNDVYEKKFKSTIKDEFKKSIKYILNRNILWGDALNLKTPDNAHYITFSEWSLVNGSQIKRRDFEFRELADFDPKIPKLFSLLETSDTGETIFSPMPIKDFPLMHYLKFDYESTN